MPTINIIKTSPLKNTYRVAKIQGMFDIPQTDKTNFTIKANLPIEEKPWQIGLITGASGSGKTSIAHQLWPTSKTQNQHTWTEPSLIDDFPPHLTPQEITLLLTSVGFSSTPAWLRPYNALSTGQKFRATLARTLAENPTGLIIYDEFTSTVDRTVAAAASHSIAKTIRREKTQQFVAVTCHKDIEEWLQPDWVYDTDTQKFTWGCKRRPQIEMVIRKGTRQAWPIFREHHYLTGNLAPVADIYLTYIKLGDKEERLAGFFAVIQAFGHKGWKRGHRIVILPDFQGLGIGNCMVETCAQQIWEQQGKRYRDVTSSPLLVQHRLKKPEMWRLTSAPSMVSPLGAKTARPGCKTSVGRLTTSWVYVPKEKSKAKAKTNATT